MWCENVKQGVCVCGGGGGGLVGGGKNYTDEDIRIIFIVFISQTQKTNNTILHPPT